VKQELRMRLFAFAFLVASAALAADPYCPTDAERARWTMHDMMSWKTALDAYKTDHNQYPAIKTADDARAAVEPTYIKHLPMTDAWGHPYHVESNATSFRVVSAGADGIFRPDTWTVAGQLPSFDDDAVVTNEGRWWSRRWEFK
jgi:type II secretion system (T2SS) protein G